MSHVSNYLTGDTHLLVSSVGSWSLIDAEPHTLEATRGRTKFENLGSLLATAGSSNPIQAETEQIAVGDQIGLPTLGFVWVYSEVRVDFTVAVHVYNPSLSSASATATILPNRWTLVSVVGTTPVGGSYLRLGFSVDGMTSGDQIWMTNPVVFPPDGVSGNIFAGEVWARLPEYLVEADATQVGRLTTELQHQHQDYPLFRFLDVLHESSNEVLSLWDTYRYITPEDGGGDFDESLLLPESASLEVLRWWAQILGVVFYDPSAGSTPWINFSPTPGDPWASIYEELDINPDDGILSWLELEGFDSTVTGLLELLRWEIRTAYLGLRAGTKEAIVESVKKVLTGTKTATFTPLDGGNPWIFRVQTLQSETPETPALGSSSATVVAIVAGAIPAGFQFIHETVAG